MLETDDWDREVTEVRLEPDEYKEMCQKLDSQRARISGLNAQLNNTKRLWEQAQQQLWQAEAEKQLAEQRKSGSAGCTDAAAGAQCGSAPHQSGAGQRGTRRQTPKKERSGYAWCSSSTQAVEHVSKSQTAGVWHSVVQTPYNTALPLEAIQPQIEQELQEKIYGRLGVAYVAGQIGERENRRGAL